MGLGSGAVVAAAGRNSPPGSGRRAQVRARGPPRVDCGPAGAAGRAGPLPLAAAARGDPEVHTHRAQMAGPDPAAARNQNEYTCTNIPARIELAGFGQDRDRPPLPGGSGRTGLKRGAVRRRGSSGIAICVSTARQS